MKFDLVKEFNGHSGCKVLLCRDADKFFVRKLSGSLTYNKRLRKQFIKQKKFTLPFVKTPEIYNYGYSAKNELFFFDMEFVRGKALSDTIGILTATQIEAFIDLLFNSLQIKKSNVNKEANFIFQNKITRLSRIAGNKNRLIKQALNKLKRFDFSNIDQSDCCGDLTLENILISDDNKIYLIDLLDSFYNSWMIDVAKLLQDLDLHWSYRHCPPDINVNLKLLISKNILIQKILKLENGNTVLLQIYYILLLNVLRIAPYAKDKNTHAFIEKSIDKIISTINTMEQK
ncbi:hypothetical protein [Endomicrobium proavitum]|uniref:Aminoglycoside phosphotransferase domain-containing protein n=1 Tax=Endomicrobium proavitum TaxID=1408281 RepID=A0A0G3WJZ5_9BACT|nr:hypothetical protein [Endomicrobium proavitum]AKL98628.1 hypothetical protein Epro_1249 [Endomicrobium proavitum]